MKLQHAVRFLAFGLLLLVIPAVLSSPSAAQIGISVRIGPPALPVYEQPICPSPGNMWTPGYWAWDDDDGYYWVPGTWVEAPQPGLLWTPGYWGWNDGVYAWNGGYWGSQIGFYGGINYGFGYGGNGFYGGEWRGGSFFYNTAVMHVNTTQITNVYVNRTVIVNNSSHVAFNGGQGGVSVRPTPQQEAFARQPHTPPVAAQVQQEHAASQNRENFARVNNGKPAVAATARPGEFKGAGVVTAKAAGAPYHAPAMSPKEARAPAPAANRPAAEGRPAESRPAANRPAADRPAAQPRPTANRPAESHPAAQPRPTESRPTENRPAAKPRATENRPAENRMKPSDHPAATPNNRAAAPARENNAKESTPKAAPREAAPRENTAPKAAAKPAAQPRESAPREAASRPAAQPRASAPHESAPKAAKPSPAPKPQKPAPPKEEHKDKQ
jgi:hypothetical protein